MRDIIFVKERHFAVFFHYLRILLGMEYKKICVEVSARFPAGGGMIPVEIVWADGKRYKVDRVISASKAPRSVQAVLPVRYTVVVGGAIKLLYFEPQGESWFVEAKV